MPFHILPYHWCQLLSLFVAFYCHKGLKHFSLLAFIPLLLITCIIDLLGSNRLFFGWQSNYFIYNMYLLLSPPFYLYLFYKMLHLTGIVKHVYQGIAIFCLVLILLNYFFIQGRSIFNSDSFLFIEIINIVFCSMVLFRLGLIDEPTKEQIYHNPYFWINLSLLLFSLGAVVVLGLQGYIASHRIALGGKNIYRIIMPNLNIILYLGYTYAFLLCRKINNKSFS